MKKKTSLFILTAALFLSSCKTLSSLYPLTENEKDFLFKKELLGKWGEAKDSTGYCIIDTVAGSGGKLYRAELTDREKDNSILTKWFLFRLVEINHSYYLDVQFDLKKVIPLKEEEYNDLVIAKHFFTMVSFIGADKLELSGPDPDEFKKLMDQKKVQLTYTALSEDDYLILNTSKQLRMGLDDSKKYSQVYKHKDILVRLK